MGKRNASQVTAAKEAKKAKVDVRVSGVYETIAAAEQIPESCRAMLAAMVPSLLTASDARHTVQMACVEMLEATLNEAKGKLEAAIADADARLKELEGSKDTLVQTISEAEACENMCQEVEQEKAVAFTEATCHAEEAAQKVQELEARKASTEKELAAATEEKANVENLVEEHFNANMAAGKGPNYAKLKVLVGSLKLEESLTNALPSSCAKSKEQRGQFDDLVLVELEKALKAHMEALAATVSEKAAAGPALASDAEAAVTLAERAAQGKKDAEEAAKAAVENLAAAKEKLAEARRAPEEILPKIREVTHERDTKTLELNHFENGTIKIFQELRDKVTENKAEETLAEEGAALIAGA